MRHVVAAPLLTLFLLVAAAPAADEKPVAPKDDAKRPAEPHPVMIRLGDGSSVRVTLAQARLDMATKFGPVSIPVGEIRSIEFAFRYPPGAAEKIEAAAARLGSDDFKVREDAAAELLAFQELAYPTLQKLTKSTDKEVARRANEMVAALREKLPEEKLRFRTQDTVGADAFTVVGRIEGASLKMKSQYFGEVALNLADLRGLRRSLADGSDKDIVVDLAKHGVPQMLWLNTGIEVTRDTVLEIRAVGESDLYPIGGERGAYRTTPNGSRQWGVSRDQKTPGQLLGRIGEKGKEFEIGEKYEGSPGAEGKLYLRVGGSPWHNVPAGEYRVKVMPR